MDGRWFLASGGQGFEAIYELFFAEGKADVEWHTGGFPVSVRITELSWRGLSELTGCDIPPQVAPDSLATGPITLNRDGRRVVIRGHVDKPPLVSDAGV